MSTESIEIDIRKKRSSPVTATYTETTLGRYRNRGESGYCLVGQTTNTHGTLSTRALSHVYR